MSTDALPAETLAAIDRLEPATVVVAVTGSLTPDAVAAAASACREAFRQQLTDCRGVLVYPDTAGLGETPDRQDPSMQWLPCPLPLVGRLPFSALDRRNLFQPLSLVTTRAGARACVLIGARPDGVTADTVEALAAPVLSQNVDLLLPSYPRHQLDGLINSGIAYPLTRALCARRADGQLGVDFGFSPRYLAALALGAAPHASERPLWLLTEAVEQRMAVAQACLDRWLPPEEPPADVSTTLVQVLGSLFEDMEHHAAMWQRTRGSQPVATFGHPAALPDEVRAVDTHAMIESFHIGFRNLHEVWARVLPPATLVGLNRLSRMGPDAFRMPDPLWVRTIFDFAMGHRLRVISRDHLLRAMTPLYLAWVASFALEIGKADRQTARERLERLCLVYEAEKPYLVARWRWPDRFNP
jgi:hypothetical protein